MNGHISGELKPWKGNVEDELTRRLSLLDGVERYSFLLWRIPEGVPFDLVDLARNPTECIQCAGDFNGRLTAEVRELVDGQAHQYVLGRAEDARDDAPADETVHWNDHDQHVRSNEVLSGSEVAELFVHYYRTGTAPDDYSRREIQL